MEADKVAKIGQAGQTAAGTADGTTVSQQIDGQAPVDQGAQTATEKKLSPKHRTVRGVPEGFKTTWVPLDMSEADNERLHKVAAVRKVKVNELLVGILKAALAPYDAQFDAEAAQYVGGAKTPGKTAKKIEDMTPEEAAAYVSTAEQRAKKAHENAMALIEQARAKARAAQAAPTA
jgi:hypothetical protein